ncbi:MAG: Gfo/Idh/MocA family oxidoreductase [Candidatus Magasanikbacteria bacterium]|nr:Gfo/Idh/MocA family oxidoreductase [Candidatus Magasanikbacteria bacterium]
MLRLLVIGGGSIGKRHTKNLLALGVNNLVIVEPDQARALEIQKTLQVKVATSIEVACEQSAFDAAVICSPSRFHPEHALLCSEKGMHLFIEKPAAPSKEGIAALDVIAKNKKIITMVGSNWKFHPLFQKMKILIEDGVVGKILSARCQFGQYLPDWHPWEDYRRGYSANQKLGGGILLDSHEFDYLTWFLGPVSTLISLSGKVSGLEIDVEDVAETILRFESGAIGEIHVDYIQRFYQREFEFFGETGSISWSAKDKKVVLESVGKDAQEFVLPADYDTNDMYVEEMKHFLHCVETNTQTITPLEQGIRVVELILAAKESNQNGRAITFSKL